jgi:hypothetical protein
MLLIDQAGKRARKVCDRCHKVSNPIKRGSLCEPCRDADRKAHAKAMEFVNWAREYQRRGA